MCFVGCNCFAFFLAFACSLFVQVVYMVLQGMNCALDTTMIGILWFQTFISLFCIIYICVPGLKMLTKLIYLHLIPTLVLFIISIYISHDFLTYESDCTIYGHDMKPLINSMYFCQGIIPVLSILILSNDLRKSCTGKKSGYVRQSDNSDDETNDY